MSLDRVAYQCECYLPFKKRKFIQLYYMRAFNSKRTVTKSRGHLALRSLHVFDLQKSVSAQNKALFRQDLLTIHRDLKIEKTNARNQEPCRVFLIGPFKQYPFLFKSQTMCSLYLAGDP